SSCKETRGGTENFDHAIDLIDRVVEVEAGASGPRQTESSHERLIAMVPATQRQAVLVRERGQIVRMHRGHHETNQSTALSGSSKHTHPGQFCQTFHRVFGQPSVVFKNRRASDSFDVLAAWPEDNPT